MLLIDTSNSMKELDRLGDGRGARVHGTQPGSAALGRLLQREADRRAAAHHGSRQGCQASLAKPPKLAEGTHIYDALAAAVAQVRGSALGGARIVLLSDGDDVGSATSLDSALQQLEEQNIRVYTVGIESAAFNADDLEKIADDTGGEYAAASSPDDLTAVYEELGFRLGNEYLLRYRSPAQPRTRTST